MEKRLLLIVFLTLLLGMFSLGWAATLNVGPGQTYTTIQSAINAANPYDDIVVAAGTYNEALNLAKEGLTITGDITTPTNVVINCGGLPGSNSSGIYVSAASVSLNGFKLIGTVGNSNPRYGIKYHAVSGGSISSVIVEDIYRSGFDFLGSSNMTVTNVTSQNNGGHGISIGDCNNMTFTNVTIGANGWEGVSVATLGHWTPLGVSGIVFNGTNTFGDYFQIEQGQWDSGTNLEVLPTDPDAFISYSTNPADNADVTVLSSDFAYAIHGDQDEEFEIYVFLMQTLTDAMNFIAPNDPDGHFTGENMYIEDIINRDQYYIGPGGTIQAAIDAANPGDVIEVAAGMYEEQLYIAKQLDIRGPNYNINPNTETRNPEAVIKYPASDAWWALVYIDGDGGGSTVSDVSLNGFEFDGVDFYGDETELIFVAGAENVSIKNNILKNFESIAIRCYHQYYDGANWVTTYPSGAIVADNHISNPVFYSNGAIYPNSGIYMQGVYGSVTGNVVEDVLGGCQIQPYNHPNTALATGAVTGNIFKGSRNALWYNNSHNANADWLYSSNDLSGIPYPSGYSAPADWYGEPADIWYGFAINGNSYGEVTFTGNTIEAGTTTLDTYGIRYVHGYTHAPATTITDNTIEDLDYGIYLPADLVNVGEIVIENNSISGNSQYAVYNGTTTEVDASPNWWGDATGPTPPDRYGNAVSENVEYDPWWADEEMETLGSDAPVENVTQNTFYNTIQEAVDAANPAGGDVITVAAGTYNESVTINKSVSVLGAGAVNTIIDPVSATNTFVVRINTTSGNVKLDGFTIRNSTTEEVGTTKISLGNGSTGATVEISNNVIRGGYNSESDYADWGFGFWSSNCESNLLFHHNNINHCYDNPVGLERHRGTSEIYYNTITDCYPAPAIWYMTEKSGTEAPEMYEITARQYIHHNTITTGKGICLAAPYGSYYNQYLGGKYTDLEISYNNITNLIENYASGIQLEADGDNGGFFDPVITNNNLTGISGVPTNLTRGIRILGNVFDATIENNSFSGLYRGIWQSYSWGQPGVPGSNGNEAHSNSFTNCVFGVDNQYTTTAAMFDATDNWWGDPAGPTPPGTRYGASVTENVLYDPWYIDDENGGYETLSENVDLYITAPSGLIKDDEMQAYSVYVSEIADLLGFTVRVKVPIADFDQPLPADFTMGPLFGDDDYQPFILASVDATHYIFDVSIANLQQNFVGGVDGLDVLLFSFELTSILDWDNVPTGCLVDIPLDNVILKNHDNQTIPCDTATGFTVIIDATEPTMDALTETEGLTLAIDHAKSATNGFASVVDTFLGLTFEDNYNLDYLKFKIQLSSADDPDDPADFSLEIAVDIADLEWVNGAWQIPDNSLNAALNNLPTGDYKIWFLAVDDASNFDIWSWNFLIDKTALDPIVWEPLIDATHHACRTTPKQNNKIDLMYTNPAGAVNNHIWVLSYSALGGVPAYPEYPATANPIPAAPNPYNSAPQNGWTQLSVIAADAAPTVTVTDRDYYYITVFVEDASGNISDEPDATFYRESISYWPGDVTGTADGSDHTVKSEDIAILSANWGLTPGNNIVDVGPTVDNARRSRPTPDDVIDIEDLMMFAMNYNNTVYTFYPRDGEPRTPIRIESQIAYSGDLMNLSFVLGDCDPFLRGLNIPLSYGSDLSLDSVTLGEIWPEGSLLLHTDRDNLLTLSLSTLGESAVEGNGTIATVSFKMNGANIATELMHMTARDIDNNPIEILNNPTDLVTDNDDLVNVIPVASYLGDCYPNPFNPSTTVRYGIKDAGSVRIDVYNSRGQLVKSLVHDAKAPGTYTSVWNGLDNNGRAVSSGLYFIRMEAQNLVQTKKALLIK